MMWRLKLQKGEERILVLSGGGSQDDVLSAELSRRGIEAFSYNQYCSEFEGCE